MGAPVYARHGFQAVKTVELDLRRWSGEDKMDFIVSLPSSLGSLSSVANLATAHAASCEAVMMF